MERGDLHRRAENWTPRRQGTAHPPAHAVPHDWHTHRRRPALGVRLSAIARADSQPGACPDRFGRAKMTRPRTSLACAALLLAALRQQQLPLSAMRDGNGVPALPVHLADTGL